MGKLSNMMYMIDLLNTGNIYSIKELSEKLGVTERMIRYYKEEISKNGIYIESFKGPNGGYFMIDKLKNYTSINKYDIQLLEYSYEVLKESKFKFLDKFSDFITKIKNMNSVYDDKSKFVSNIKLNDSNAIELAIETALEKSDKIDIVYADMDGNNSVRTIHPLQLFRYKDVNYVTAYCELRNDIRHFEIGRIVDIK
jgi:predicted DNA-binding transcriptional regulator YafY